MTISKNASEHYHPRINPNNHFNMSQPCPIFRGGIHQTYYSIEFSNEVDSIRKCHEMTRAIQRGLMSFNAMRSLYIGTAGE